MIVRLIGRGCAALLLVASLASHEVAAQRSDGSQTTDAVFAVDSTAHAGAANRIVATPDERHLVTVSHDKTIRLWDAETGQLVQRYVIPVREAVDGEMMALALSPDGELAAVGGYLRAFGVNNAVVVFSLRDGSIRHALSDLPSSIWSLAWSPDGRYLALGLAAEGGNRSGGVQIFETAGWKQVMDDRSAVGRVATLGFRRDNTLFATTHNVPLASGIQLFKPRGAGFELVASKSFGDKGGFRAYWSRDESTIYVGGHSVFDGETLFEPPHPAHARRRTGGPLFMNALRESPDGRFLYGLRRDQHASRGKVYRWALPSSGSFSEFEIPDPRLNDFVVLKSGTLAYVSDAGVVAAFDRDLKPLWRNERQVAAVVGQPSKLRVSADGNWISLPAPQEGGTVDLAFNLVEPRFLPADKVDTNWREPETGRSSMRILSWQGTQTPTVNDVRFPMRKERERSLSVALHSREDAFVFGSSNFYLRKVDARGTALWSRYLQADVSAVNLIESRNLIVAATANGFLHLVRWSDGKPLLSYYLEPGARKWIAVSPAGDYEAGIGAEDLAGWVVSSGRERMADFFPLSRLRQSRLSVGLVRRTLEGSQLVAPAAESPDRAAQLALVEAERQKAARVAEAEAARQAAAKLAEAARLKAEQAAEAARLQALAEAEALQRAEAERREAARLAEIARREAEARRLAAERAEQLRREEQARIAAELARQAEATRLALEQQRREEEQKALQLKLAELEREQAARKLAEEKRQAEEQRLAEEKRVAEAKRIAEEQRVAEEKRLAEAKRLAEEAKRAEAARLEAERLAEEKRRQEMLAAEKAREHQSALAAAALAAAAKAAAAVPAVPVPGAAAAGAATNGDESAVVQATAALEKLPPVVDVISPGFEVAARDKTLSIRFRVRTPDGAPVTSVRGRVVSRGDTARAAVPLAAGAAEQEMRLELPPEDAEIQLVAENRWGPSVPATIRVRWQGAVPAGPRRKGVLHIVAVGVSEYDNPNYRLGYAAKDARDFAGELGKQAGGFYSAVKLHLLTDREAAKAGIETAFARLRDEVGSRDTTMVFLAGHGINDPAAGEYLYLPREANLSRLQDTGVSFRKLGDVLASLPGRTVMFVDTCHSGNVVARLGAGANQNNAAAVNELASSEKNIVVFASSTGEQASLEHDAWGNGAFTKALLEGFAGKADLLKRGRITYKQLDAYVADRVDELTEGKQTPVTPVLVTVPDFTLAEVKK